jgi:competence protein ComEC
MQLKTIARPIIPILMAYMAGIVLGEQIPGHSRWVMGGAIIAIACAGWQLWKKRASCIPPMGLFLAIGYLSIQSWVAPDLPEHHVIHYANSQKWTITGIVAEAPIVRPNGQKLILGATHLKIRDREHIVCGRIQISVGRGEGVDLKRGDRIQVTGRLKRVIGFHNPGGFNYERYMGFKRIWCRMWVPPKRVILLDRPVSATVSRRIENSRQTVSDLIDTALIGESRVVLKALVIGDRSGITPRLREVFNRTGIGHLLAISGLHIGIVASVAFIFFKWLLSYSRFLLHRAWAGKLAAIFTFIPVVIYGVMAGMSPSTQRAVVMVAVFLLAYLAGKIQDAFNTLAVAGVVILAIYPPAIFSISFQLSFAAVGFIILGISRPWPANPSRIPPRFPVSKKVVSLMGGTVLAILGTLPLVMRSFNETSLIGVGVNLLAVPLIGFIAVPAGLLGMFIHPICTTCATICFGVAGFFLDIALTIAHFLADLPFASVKTITPSIIEVAFYYVLVSMGMMLAPVFLAYLKGLNPRTQPGPATIKPLVAIMLLAGVVAMADIGYWVYQRYWRSDLRVTIIDVGTASAALVEFPRGPVMLIDGGGFSDNSVFDVGARVVAPVLWRKKIMTVDTMVLSHPNSDHLNGLIYIANYFNVKRLWNNGESVDTDGYRDLTAVIAKKKIASPAFCNLTKTHNINGAKVDILYPPKMFLEKVSDEHWRDPNNNSLVVKVSMGDVSFLFPGDIEKEAEKELVALKRDALPSTILIAPHHGSKTSSSAYFLDAVSPETVVISCARAGRYHFPHPTVLKRYRTRGYQVLSTGESGAIQMLTDGQKIEIRPNIFFNGNSCGS